MCYWFFLKLNQIVPVAAEKWLELEESHYVAKKYYLPSGKIILLP